VMQRDGGFESDLSLPRAGDPRQRGGLGSAARAGVEAPSSYPTCILQDMSESSAHRHHAIDYVEFTVTDLEQAKRFYTQAFGWRFNDYGPEYAGIQSEDVQAAVELRWRPGG
jgi:hypothetical protein